MYLQRLTLLNYRSYRQLDTEMPRGPVVLHGDNAQGKTNFLEAVYLLSIAKSFRADNERQVVNHEGAQNEGQAMVAGRFHTREDPLEVRVGFQCLWPPGADRETSQQYRVRKRIRVNGAPVTAARMVGLASVVLFSATDVDLVFGAPSVRRRFLDILISQADRQYLRSLQRYQKVVHQRNQLLRLLREGKASEEEIVFWNDELVKEGAFILRRRRETLSAIAVLAREHLRTLTSGNESLEVQYVPSAPLDGVDSEEEALTQALNALKDRERALGITLVGPHRDDAKLMVDGSEMATYASRGQARSIGLALRLAEATHLSDLKGEEPILLLDDVLSELDSSRRQQVMEAALAHEQAIITTADLGVLERSLLSAASIFRVTRGTIDPSDVSLR